MQVQRLHAMLHDERCAFCANPHAWKRVLQERIWSPHGPKGMAARGVLTLLMWHADALGRT